MAYWKSDALLLRVIDYGETSKIATFFSRERGKMAAIAKGAKRRGSALNGVIEPLTRVEIVCVKRRDSAALHTLAELDVRETYRGARQDLRRLYAATYVVEFLRELLPEEDPHPDLYDHAAASLSRIAAAPPEGTGLLVIAFEARALELLGLFPSLGACVDCGGAADDRDGARRFAPARGGIVCAACAARDRTARETSAGALHALELFGRDPEKAARVRLAAGQREELRGLLDACIAAHLNRPLRLARYL